MRLTGGPATVLFAVAGLALNGCGGGGGGGEVTVLPECVHAQPPASTAGWLPDRFPLPQGTLLEKRRRTAGGTNVVEGYVPGDLRSNAEFFQQELVDAGYTLGTGDSEEHEMETFFADGRRDGFLKLRTLARCDGALTLAIALTRK